MDATSTRGLSLITIPFSLKKKDNSVGSVGCVGKSQKSPENSQQKVSQNAYTAYTAYTNLGLELRNRLDTLPLHPTGSPRLVDAG